DQCLARYTECPGRSRLVPPVRGQGLQNSVTFFRSNDGSVDLTSVGRRRTGAREPRPGELFPREVRDVNLVPLAQNETSIQRVLQLADVARPRIGKQHRLCFQADFRYGTARGDGSFA